MAPGKKKRLAGGEKPKLEKYIYILFNLLTKALFSMTQLRWSSEVIISRNINTGICNKDVI